MHCARFGWVFCLVLLAVPAWAQRASRPEQASISQASRDPQGLNVLNQVLIVGGGTSAVSAIKDYSASGDATYHFDADVAGTVTLKGLGLERFRVDANLPNGTRTHVVSGGRTQIKAADGQMSSFPPQVPTPGEDPSPIPSSDAFPYQSPKFPGSIAVPLLQMAAVVADPNFSITYKGIVEVDGHSAYDIQVQPHWPGSVDPMSQYHTNEFLVDSSTFQLVMVQDMVPKNVLHQIRYSDYRPVSGILVPFVISEEMGGQSTWKFQLDQVSFNTGLQDSDFVL